VCQSVRQADTDLLSAGKRLDGWHGMAWVSVSARGALLREKKTGRLIAGMTTAIIKINYCMCRLMLYAEIRDEIIDLETWLFNGVRRRVTL
jgi:hypothetical protein